MNSRVEDKIRRQLFDYHEVDDLTDFVFPGGGLFQRSQKTVPATDNHATRPDSRHPDGR